LKTAELRKRIGYAIGRGVADAMVQAHPIPCSLENEGIELAAFILACREATPIGAKFLSERNLDEILASLPAHARETFEDALRELRDGDR
jgi:hypothetical protein